MAVSLPQADKTGSDYRAADERMAARRCVHQRL